MKDLFFEYYQINEEKIKSIWDDCLFSYDTNVLLNLYGYSEQTRIKFFEIIEKLIDRTIVSHQSAYEFQKNRLITISGQSKAYDNLIEFLESHFEKIKNELNGYKKHTYIQATAIIEKFEKTFKSTTKDLKRLKENHPDWTENDLIRDKVTELFTGRISPPPKNEELAEIYKTGKIRYDKKIPPGYADLKDKQGADDNSLYGDLIIWNQIMNFSKEKPANLVFVTDDLKDDWWYKHNGKTISARPELIKEFYETTGKNILIYNADRFLSYASSYTKIDVTNEVVKEVETLRERDESSMISQRLDESYKSLFETVRRQNDLMHMLRNNANLAKSFEDYRTQGSILNSLRERLEADKRLYESLKNPFINFNTNEDVLKYLRKKSDESEKGTDSDKE